MCICLSVSQEVTSILCSPQPAQQSPLPHTTRHRRSVSDTQLFQKVIHSTGRREVHSQYSKDDTSPYHACLHDLLTTNVATFIPTPPPPPLRSSHTNPKLIQLSIKDAIVKYNVYDNIPAASISPNETNSTTPPPPAPQNPKPCAVCFESFPPKDFLAYQPCAHSFCKECVREHLKILVSMSQKLVCLYPNCKSIFSADHAREMMDDKTYERYLLLLKTPAGAHRWCPRPGCDTPYIKSDSSSSSSQVTCSNSVCELVFCYDCRVKWHEGETCEEYQAKRQKEKPEEELLSEKFAKENLQECPKCNIWVEKIDGCEYVQCTVCQHEFCWDCLEPHDHNMGAHVHGPRYKPSSISYRHVHRVRRARGVRVARMAGIGVAACVLGPPAIAIGAAVAVVALPVWGIKGLVQYARRRRHKKKMAREALNMVTIIDD